MKVDVKYFGMIAETIGTSMENVELDVLNDFDLRLFFENKYPDIKKINFKIAVNQELTDSVINLRENSEIALLPPFAGG